MILLDKYVSSFRSRIREDGPVVRPELGKCFNWTGKLHKQGYGVIWAGKHILAHRFSWAIHNGEIPAGLNVLHKCDNPPCCNPNHLFLGTQSDNVRDMLKKGRCARICGDLSSSRLHPESRPRGEAVKTSVLTEQQVRSIRARYALGESAYRISKDFPVSYASIKGIVKGRSWRHLLLNFRTNKSK